MWFNPCSLTVAAIIQQGVVLALVFSFQEAAEMPAVSREALGKVERRSWGVRATRRHSACLPAAAEEVPTR